MLTIDSNVDLGLGLIGEEPFVWDRLIEQVGAVICSSGLIEGQPLHSSLDRGQGIVGYDELLWAGIVSSESDEEISSILIVGAIGGVPNLCLVHQKGAG